jgi:hypothetical protein
METYLVYNKNKREDHDFFNAANDEEIYHKIINNLDSSKEWIYYSLDYLLNTYNLICDTLDYDYEFYDNFDIINNHNSFIEILDLMEKHPEIKISHEKLTTTHEKTKN